MEWILKRKDVENSAIKLSNRFKKATIKQQNVCAIYVGTLDIFEELNIIANKNELNLNCTEQQEIELSLPVIIDREKQQDFASKVINYLSINNCENLYKDVSIENYQKKIDQLINLYDNKKNEIYFQLRSEKNKKTGKINPRVYLKFQKDSINYDLILAGLTNLNIYKEDTKIVVYFDFNKRKLDGKYDYDDPTIDIKYSSFNKEGKKIFGKSVRYERNENNRKKCLEYYGYKCQVCDMNFFDIYGERGREFIHVHHKEFLFLGKGKQKKINPVEDLIPVCPNCHAMLHKKDKDGNYVTFEELKKIITNYKKEHNIE